MKNQLNLLVTIAWQMYQCVNSPFNQIEMELNYATTWEGTRSS